MPSNEGPNVVQDIPRVLVIGGSYSGLAATVNLLDLSQGGFPRFTGAPEDGTAPGPQLPVDITIVDERDGYCELIALVCRFEVLTMEQDHLIGNPLAFASNAAAAKSWTKFRDIPALKLPNVRFVQGSVSTVDCEKKTASIVDTITKENRQIGYDYLLVASGLRRTFPVVPAALDREEFLSEARAQTQAIKNAKEGVVVIGGGESSFLTPSSICS